MTPERAKDAKREAVPFAGPDFIIIGAMKCGTTSLWAYLDSHPGITMSEPKETNFFKTERDLARGLDWYRSCFERGSGMRPTLFGDASPNYTKAHAFPGVPERIARQVPGVKLIYVVRDPIERLLSHYMHNVAVGREQLPLDQVIEPGSGYVQTSMYARQLREYREFFPDDALMVVDVSDLGSKTLETVTGILRFLGISTDVAEEALAVRYHRSEVLRRPDPLQRRLPAERLRKIADRSLPRSLRERMDKETVRSVLRPFLPRTWTDGEPVERPVLTDRQRESLVELFEPDIAELQSVTGLPSDTWLR